MLIAHFSDLHIDEAESPNTKRLQAALARLKKIQPTPELLLITGDLTQHGRPRQYHLLRHLLHDCGPYVLVPGNHDDALLTHQFFPNVSPPAGGMLCIDLKGLRLALIDSCIACRDYGELSTTLLDTVALALDHDRQPTLLAMHHPPVSAQVPAIEGMSLRQTAVFQKWVKQRPYITAVLAGHYHQAQFATLEGGCPVIVAPSIAPSLVMDFTANSFQIESSIPSGMLHLWKNSSFSSYPFFCDSTFGFVSC